MKRALPILALTLLLVSCGGDDSGTGPDDDGGNGNGPNPVPTAEGTPIGTPVTETIGAAGGSVVSADGLFSLDIPAGALASDTEITIQPVTNTAWGGVSTGYQLTPDGLTFSTPVDLVFQLDPDSLAGSHTDFVDVAVQLDNGTWGVLKNRTLDEDSGTLTCTTTHFSNYSLIIGAQIRPASAIVAVTQSLVLNVQFCSRDPIPGDPDLASLLITCDVDLVPLGNFRNWSVNGAVGGSGTFGTVSPTTGPQVTFQAPAEEPNPNVVAVSVQTTFQGMQALLVSNITIVGAENWTGNIRAEYPGGDIATALIEWTLIGTFENQKYYTPIGPVEYTLPPGDCAFVSLTPDDYVFAASDGLMTIDYNVDPPAVFMAFATSWPATHCYQCPDHPVQCSVLQIGVGFTVEDVVIGPDLDLIEALGNVLDETSYTYRFERVPPP